MSNNIEEKQEKTPDYLLVYKDVTKYKKNTFYLLDDSQQTIFLNLLNIYSKKLIGVCKENLPLEGSEEYNSNKSHFDNLKKKCNEYGRDVTVFKKARDDFEEKQRFLKMENENNEIKKEFQKQKEENEKSKKEFQKQKEENEELKKELKRQADALAIIMKQLPSNEEKPSELKRTRDDETYVIDKEDVLKKNKLDD
ncbi:14377_t:CDS:1 [Cetraspora pellucida]|uniref:14377_t:CDS:1 n=1 Tax=Cetraspora pellucida TaxID=1433469 RepID=A0ACA9P2E0_9GLOM|nr:14377_t:CDS:1 [Cetraspora pellucida]